MIGLLLKSNKLDDYYPIRWTHKGKLQQNIEFVMTICVLIRDCFKSFTSHFAFIAIILKCDVGTHFRKIPFITDKVYCVCI